MLSGQKFFFLVRSYEDYENIKKSYLKHKEFFIHRKAIIPYVQLSTNCRIGFWFNEKIYLTVLKLSNPQLVENCTNHRVPVYEE